MVEPIKAFFVFNTTAGFHRQDTLSGAGLTAAFADYQEGDVTPKCEPILKAFNAVVLQGDLLGHTKDG